MAQNTPLTQKQRFWLKHIQACTKSGHSMRAYAESHGLRISDLYSWKKTLRQKGLVGQTKADESPLFHKVLLTDQRPSRCTLRLPSGLCVEFDAHTNPLWLGELMRALS